ncbi:Lrp/AsnC family transcriptional regulator [Bacteriovorax sp. DB6_IX]|uniref:Lrp/AsnC family transcriptional regulator n=1 Tax=Bacteriovorax sp. DB6_IX TaxID=1353530 RepID=UPI00038A49A3|nr:Lrp/AsnC family transcriptional regulator [Bacteriovorax sp. DB6_IX]EQC51578.1 putative leucine-responsive regulatory protein [Bacteriovorax sp. DB6_IX]
MTKIDEINENILQELNKNGRISNTDLAAKIGLSPSACLRRVQELEESGIIKGYRAILDKQKLNIGFVAYVSVGLSSHTKKSQKDFEKAISQATDVVECHNVAGSFEYLLRVETSDLHSYKAFHTDILGTLPQVNSITTYVVMESSKDHRE